MGHFSEIFVRRPVLAWVINLIVLMLGLRSIQELNVRQYPETSSAVITISTPYLGANADLVRGFISTPLEAAIASAEGIEFLESSSAQGLSTIRARLELNYDPNAAVAQILTRINEVRNQLPAGSEDPVVTVSLGEQAASMYVAFLSDVLAPNQITDYLVRTVRPRLESIPGVQQAQIFGGQEIALRLWLDPRRLAAANVTAAQVREALAANNFIAAAGEIKGAALSIPLDLTTSLHTVQDFEQLVIRRSGAAITRLRDVGTVVLGAESYDSSVFFDGTPAVFIAIEAVPTANALDVIDRVRGLFPEIQRALPSGIKSVIVYDATEFIRSSFREVVVALIQALVIVTLVIYLFLGSIRSALIPAVAMPLSLVGAIFLMWLLGYSFNLLTLLALVLAIGTVVDDGIVVVENVYRHLEEGKDSFDAAILTANELVVPIIAMNVVVLAVFLPVGFMAGLTGNLFTEFAFTVAGATLISGIVAITLSPVMSAQLLRREQRKTWLSDRIDRGFNSLSEHYRNGLDSTLRARWLVLGLGALVLLSCYFLYRGAESELAPTEDQGFVIVTASGDPNGTIDRLEQWTEQIGHILQGLAATEHSFVINAAAGQANSAFAGISMKPWDQRAMTQAEVIAQVQAQVARIAGLQTAVFPPPALPGAGRGTPVQLIISSTEDPLVINESAQPLLEAARRSGKFVFIDTNLKFDRLQISIDIDRNKAADLGIDMRALGTDLATLLSAGYVNLFSTAGRSYRVIPQVERQFRLTPEQLHDYQVRTESGALVPLSTFITLRQSVQPRELLRFNQLNSATLSGVPAPGVSLGEAVDYLRDTAQRLLPLDYVTDWAGESRQYVQEGSALVTAFMLAVILMYLVLAAQFESFRAPAIMLVSVPMSLAGALLFFALGVVTVNIYTQVGLLALIASIIRHGILLVEFATQLQRTEHLKRQEAIQKAAALRLRPILMTTVATLVGMIPLIFAGGPGAESRFAIGFVLGAGMALGTFFTLFMVPALYVVAAKETGAPPHPPTL